jgi:ubiquinol-cytochrome c reductase cytochrome b subunit
MTSMLSQLTDWLDNRTGYRERMSEALYEEIPGGSKWIYVTGSMLVFAFVTQVTTGIFLWMYYSPGSQNAWESVYYIEHVVQGGWLLRGVHHYMAQAMVVLLPLHLLQVVLAKAYVAPREINYWLGLVLMLIVLGLGLTGYLLPWDQKGYWATKVATELASLPPGGEFIQKLVVGGSEYGHLTLTRFFALHAGVLPALLVIVLVLHVTMFRRHGITARSSENRSDEYFWPRQVYKDAVACFLLLVAVISITYLRGTELGPPAEPTESYGAARPEWYFLFLFELLKKFDSVFVGAIVVPTLVMAFLFAMPLIGRIRYLHSLNVAVLLVLLGCAGYLTYEAIDHDNYHVWHPEAPSDPDGQALWAERVEAAKKFHHERDRAHRETERVVALIEHSGIPRVGALEGLVHGDPEIQGPRIFERNCASCHSYLDNDGHGIAGPEPPADWDGVAPYGAPNLYDFASRTRLAGLLDPEKIVTPDYFGTSYHGLPDADGELKSGGMVEFVRDTMEVNSDQLQSIVAALSAEAKLVHQQAVDAEAEADGTLAKGRAAIVDGVPPALDSCIDCHKFHDDGDVGMGAPDLTGYFSPEWLYDFIANPSHDRFYGEDNNDRMPSFAADPQDPSRNLLSDHELKMLVRWLRGDERVLGSTAAQ